MGVGCATDYLGLIVVQRPTARTDLLRLIPAIRDLVAAKGQSDSF
jgi:hypothetical protein